MENLILALCFVLTAAAGVMWYRRADRSQPVRPRLLSWYVWAVIHVILTIAVHADGRYIAAVLALTIALVAICLGAVEQRRHGAQFRSLDAVVMLVVLAATGGWILLDGTRLLIVLILLFDAVAGIPLLRHYARQSPVRLWPYFALMALAGGVASSQLGAWSVSEVLVPLYISAYNLSTLAIIVLRRQHATQEPDFEQIEVL